MVDAPAASPSNDVASLATAAMEAAASHPGGVSPDVLAVLCRMLGTAFEPRIVLATAVQTPNGRMCVQLCTYDDNVGVVIHASPAFASLQAAGVDVEILPCDFEYQASSGKDPQR